LVSDIGWTGVAELRIAADLPKFAKKGIQLSEIKRVSDLTDQVRSPEQARLGVGLLVVLIRRNREPGQLYCTVDSIRIDEQLLRITLAEENLRAPDMPNLEEGV
jgi:hypothetical protein